MSDNNNDLYKYFDYRKDGRVGILISKSVIRKAIKIKETMPTYGQDIKISTRKEKKKAFNARKVDFNEVNKRNKEIGEEGELFVLKHEIEYLGEPLGSKVRYVAKDDGDGAGYDILSYDKTGQVRFLEVKTTTAGLETPFYLTENERLFLEMYGDEAEIVRVYNFDMQEKSGQVYRISGNEFLEKISLQAIGYKEFNITSNSEEAKELIKKNTRNYAKRQLTFFKHQFKDVIWFNSYIEAYSYLKEHKDEFR